MQTIPARALAVAAGGLLLWLFNLAMDPVPVAAAPAFALGGGSCLFAGTVHKPWIAAGAASAGAIIGVLVHRGWHLEGLSPPAPNGLYPHLIWEGLLGLGVACVCVAVVWSVIRHQPSFGK